MARTKGIFPFTGTLEVASTAPLDARLLVKTKADLMLEGTWKMETLYICITIQQ